MRVPVVALLLTVGILAGCISDEPGPILDDPGLPVTDAPLIVRFAANGTVLDDPLPEERATPVYLPTGHSGAEPNIGITSSGAVFASASSNVVRSLDRGETWDIVHTHRLLNSDPMLWVDPWTEHIYNAPMFPTLLCASIYDSADDGDTWTPAPRPDCGRGVYDHQKLASGPPGPDAPPVAGVAHPTVLYICYNALVATQCAISYDNGHTWPHDTIASGQGVSDCGGINGHPTVSEAGIVAFANTRSCAEPQLVFSTDSGLTWTQRTWASGVGAETIDPEIAFTPDGTLYLLWRGSDHRTYLGRTADLGQTWDGPFDVTPPGVTSTVFAALGAGDDGRIGIAYLGTDHPEAESPSDAPADARWHLWMVGSDDAASETPTFTAYRATPDEDPVQIGCVWLGGGSEPCRNMLDFIDGAVHPDGTFFVAYTEGCHQGCANETDAADDDSRARVVSVGRLDGFSLYGAAAMPMASDSDVGRR